MAWCRFYRLMTTSALRSVHNKTRFQSAKSPAILSGLQPFCPFTSALMMTNTTSRLVIRSLTVVGVMRRDWRRTCSKRSRMYECATSSERRKQYVWATDFILKLQAVIERCSMDPQSGCRRQQRRSVAFCLWASLCRCYCFYHVFLLALLSIKPCGCSAGMKCAL